MAELIIVKPELCVGCNACVRNCPAPEANITRQLENGNFVTTVNPDKCIGCGECVRNCQHGARDYIDDTDEAMSTVVKEKVSLIVAPSIKSVFPDKWKTILDWFKGQGCSIFDVSFGADICTWAHLRAVENGRVGNIITQPCAAIVKYIETYQPILLKNLSPIHSPMLCEAVYLRTYLRRREKLIALSPCIAKKTEFEETGLVDYNVTFKKLQEWFKKNEIDIAVDSHLVGTEYDYPFDDEQGQLGSVYPRAGGLRDNLWAHSPDLNITNSEGVNKVYSELDMYAKLSDIKKPQIFDVLSCEFGCNVGAGTGSKRTIFDVMDTMRNVEKYAKSRQKRSGGFFRGAEDKLFKRFDDELRIDDFIRKYVAKTPSPVPTDEQLEPIFEKMGKHTPEERNYNCRACGYKGCREMAAAIFRGLNTPSNCVIHAKSVLLARHSEINRERERLALLAAQCAELSTELKTDVDGISENMSEIRNDNVAMNDRSKNVHELLENVIEFCNQYEELDNNSLRQLVEILTNTTEAFDALNKNVENTSINSDSVGKHIYEIQSVVNRLNDILAETDKV